MTSLDRRSPAERITDYRRNAEHSGEQIAHLSDAEVLLCVLDAQITERARIQALYDRLLHGQARRERDVYSAAARAAKDERMAWRDIYISALIREALAPISAVLYQVEQLPARPGPAQTERVKQYARQAAEMLRRQPHSADLSVATRWRDEVWHLRDLITATGRALHEDGRQDQAGTCRCRGCELIRAMDPAPQPAHGGAALRTA